MERFEVGGYFIEVEDIRSSNNESYDFNYTDDDLEYRLSSYLGIKIYQNQTLLNSASIGATAGATGLSDSALIVEESRIVACCSNIIFCLAIPELTLLWKVMADFATCFQIFPYQDDYIVHGEVEISRINHSGNIVWQQSGADIFVSLDGSNYVMLTQDYIEATDWNSMMYRFDYDGNNLPIE